MFRCNEGDGDVSDGRGKREKESIYRSPDVGPNVIMLLLTVKEILFIDENYQPTQLSPTMQLARQMGASSHKVQLMKASFYMDDIEDYHISEFIYINSKIELGAEKSLVGKVSFEKMHLKATS